MEALVSSMAAQIQGGQSVIQVPGYVEALKACKVDFEQ